MSYTAEQFIEDVKKEATALRQHATADEIHRLEVEDLDPSDVRACIYGQMTGNCTSLRASDLIFACCSRYFDNDRDQCFIDADEIIHADKGTSAGEAQTANDLFEYRRKDLIFLSAIESYILIPKANVTGLVSYLKGETDTLEL